MESKIFLIKKLYADKVAGECAAGLLWSIKPSLLTHYLKLDEYTHVRCTVNGLHEYTIHSIHCKDTYLNTGNFAKGFRVEESDAVVYDEVTALKLEKFGAYYNFMEKKWQIDVRITENKEYKAEIENILKDTTRID